MYLNKINQQKLINKMSNWQRTQWSKANYPDSKEELEKYIKMKKPGGVGVI